MSIQELQQEIVADFSLFDNTSDKYNYIIELGKRLSPLDEKHRLDSNLIKGCQSKVWMVANLEDGKVIYQANSDALIVKGLVSLLVQVLSKRNPQEIIDADLFFIEQIGLSQMLSMTRSNGLASMLKQMKSYAIAFSTLV